ncbi:DUF960 family protein [Metaclostridioides mangenotii]|uniref:DUF960 family protein n=1 Tax=Metaclostridioides mangenotii TaxID=1540 RepID=UPI000480D86F|nr:DUF960 family protein [Clostridioides mangenotii]
MFNKEKRYMTVGVQNEIPVSIQIKLWNKIDELKIEKDYFQIFELIPIEDGALKIVHKQEDPKYKKVSYLITDEIKCAIKIYVIDAGYYSTMLLDTEY